METTNFSERQVPEIGYWDGDCWRDTAQVSDRGTEQVLERGSAQVLGRGIEYGDGLFETFRVTSDGRIPLLRFHLQRVRQGLAALDFPVQSYTDILTALHALQQPGGMLSTLSGVDAQLKVIIERQANWQVVGDVARGYDFRPEQGVQLHAYVRPAPAFVQPERGVVVGINPVSLSQQPLLAGIKHLNRLEQVLARRHFKPEWQESLMLTAAGDVIEGCMSNLYILEGDRLVTPLLEEAGVNGVARRWLLSQIESPIHSATAGDESNAVKKITQGVVDLPRLRAADGVLFSNTLTGFYWAAQVGDQTFSRTQQANTQRICQSLQTAFRSEFS